MRWLHQLHDCRLPPWEVSARFVRKGFPLQKLFWFIHVYLKLIQCHPFLKLLNRGISLTGSVYRSSLSLLRSGIMLAIFLLFGTKRYIFSYFNQQLYIPVTGLATVAITKLGSMFQYLIFFWLLLLLSVTYSASSQLRQTLEVPKSRASVFARIRKEKQK